MAGGKTFLAWLLRQHERADVVGDLARFALRDPAFPRSAVTKAAYQRYLAQQVIPWQVQMGLRQGWQEWQQTQHAE